MGSRSTSDLFFPIECVTVTSGRVAKSGIAGDVGRWFHSVSYIGADGAEKPMMSSTNLGVARHQGFQIAIKKGCMFIDRSEKEPRR